MHSFRYYLSRHCCYFNSTTYYSCFGVDSIKPQGKKHLELNELIIIIIIRKFWKVSLLTYVFPIGMYSFLYYFHILIIIIITAISISLLTAFTPKTKETQVKIKRVEYISTKIRQHQISLLKHYRIIEYALLLT